VHHSCGAWAMNSGPLSIRRWVGAGYCFWSSSMESITSLALHRLPTTALRRRSGLRSFPSHRKVRPTAQQAL
jgi:hypothetical protein